MSKKSPSLPVLIIDDEEQVLVGAKMALSSYGINNVLTCNDSRQVINILKSRDIDVILLDLAMPHLTGDNLLPQISEKFPHIPVIVVTGFNDVDRAVECMNSGAFDYMVKPVEPSRLASGIQRAIEMNELRRENSLLSSRFLSTQIKQPDAFSEIITHDPIMQAIFRYIEAIASSPESVLITGETGVGKELIVKAIHQVSGCDNNLVSINVAGLEDDKFTDTLFGHSAGAFTNATESRSGLIEKAAGGILFLDEIGDLNNNCQVKLLRLLQEREYLPLGSDSIRHCSARIVVATHRNLNELLEQKVFRKDLFYRLMTHHIHVPPLRSRIGDLDLLVKHFLAKSARSLNKDVPTVSRELVPLLATYDFPGNIRELEAMISDAISRHDSKMLSFRSIRNHISQRKTPYATKSVGGIREELSIVFPIPLPTITKVTQLLIKEALDQSGGNQALAAQMLGISPSALSQRLKSSRTKESGK